MKELDIKKHNAVKILKSIGADIEDGIINLSLWNAPGIFIKPPKDGWVNLIIRRTESYYIAGFERKIKKESYKIAYDQTGEYYTITGKLKADNFIFNLNKED